ncbi:acyl-CoA dehydrogenase [Phenylobacterium sp.]|uniref:acyl-CoA dehydrogenase family protein n=1 Tax=Phenylobacterium sp. TaxID=1871053 RepID=UPI0025F088B0|nr:acyl-CoA dehydrogenase [Phenylobacterium sp.]
MNFALSDDHRMLRDSARAFLDEEVNLQPLLKRGATVEQVDYLGMWGKIAELGWPSLIVPEAYQGLGMSCLDLAMILQEMGRALLPCPISGALAGVWSILKGGSEAQKERLLPMAVTGDLKLALAVCDADGTCDGPASDARATADGDDWRLNGSKAFVVDAAAADMIVVAAENGGRRGLYLVDATAAGVEIELLRWRDTTRQLCNVRFANASAELIAADDAEIWPWIKDRLLLVLSAENAGGLQKVLEMSTEYAKQRMAFGRPIGANQAIKHGLAETFGLVECSNAAVLYAAWMLSEAQPSASLAATMAKAYTSDAYRKATHQNIQVFGAIGFTWEMTNHLYFKRARANAEMLGGTAELRSHVIDLLMREAA